MYTWMKPVGLKKALSVLCVTLCLLSTLSAGAILSAKAASASVIVGPSDSIQAAINNATAGDTILVLVGTYNESLEVNKSISLIGEGIDQTIIDGQNNQFTINITVDNVNIEGFTIQSAFNPSYGINMFGSKGDVISYNKVENSQQGIALTSSNTNTISNNIIIANTQQGIALTSCSKNTISDNTITANAQGGIALFGSNNNFFSGNTVSDNNGGFSIYLSGPNLFSGNTFSNNPPTGDIIQLYSTNNVFYDNNFNDTVQVDPGLKNIWDNGLEGNHWSNYAGHNRGDGTGIENYVAPGIIDHHPLMGEFHGFDATLTGETYQASIISNSTVSGFGFEVGTETGNKIIHFNVSGPRDTVGFSRITIPTGLMNTSVLVLVGEKETAPTWLNSQNTAYNYLYLTYTQSNQTILIISSRTLDLYNQLLNETDTLNATYTTLLNSYANLMGNYSQLQQSYLNLTASYQEHLLDYNQNLQNVRSIMYMFAAATAILIIITVYLSKQAHSRPTKPPEDKERF
jgi:parallel beta-helix repeat protein